MQRTGVVMQLRVRQGEVKGSRSFLEVLTSVALLGVMIFGTTGQAAAATVIYVKVSATGLNNGTSWANAYKSLQVALAHAVSGQQIWVAKGTYKPSARPVWTSDPRGVAFSLISGVAIYGGFAGTETLLSQRNWMTNVTILSGDVGKVGDASDNAYDVLLNGLNSLGVNSTAVLDGFTITGGQANCGCWPGHTGGAMFNWTNSSPTLRNLIISGNYGYYGGGMYNNAGSNPTLTNVVFSGNRAAIFGDGGGMYNAASSPKLTNVTFSGNSASNNGGGMFNTNSSPSLTKVAFTGNSATSSGGGLYNDSSSPKLTNVTFTSNSAPGNGGGMFNTNSSSPSLTNVTFTGNSTNGNGGGMYNDSSSPKLVNVTFKGNSATSNGGAIYSANTSNPSITNATFSSNSAGNNGGAIYNDGSLMLTGATLSHNSASSYGGGIFNNSGNSALADLTFAGNFAIAGGGIFIGNGSPALINATFSGNTASANGGAMFVFSGSPVVYNSIFWGDSPQEILSAPTLTINYSILQGTTCPGTCTAVYNLDPKLGPLQNNGGFTQTMALGAGSAAIDTGNMPTCVIKDQRGVPRPQGGACDMGAYEVRAMTFTSQGPNDGQVLESATVNNVGGSVDTTSGGFHVGDNGSDRRFRGFLSFNTAALPDAATIVLARVTVKQAAPTVGNPFVTLGPLVADLANPYFGTGIGLVSTDWQAGATVVSAGTWQPDGSLYWTALNGTAESHISKTGTTQIRLRFTFSDTNHLADYITLYSGDTTTVSNRPTFTVYFNP